MVAPSLIWNDRPPIRRPWVMLRIGERTVAQSHIRMEAGRSMMTNRHLNVLPRYGVKFPHGHRRFPPKTPIARVSLPPRSACEPHRD